MSLSESHGEASIRSFGRFFFLGGGRGKLPGGLLLTRVFIPGRAGHLQDL